jgi:hypothetical protein
VVDEGEVGEGWATEKGGDSTEADFTTITTT